MGSKSLSEDKPIKKIKSRTSNGKMKGKFEI